MSDSDSDLSSILSSAESVDLEEPESLKPQKPKGPIDSWLKRQPTESPPPKRKRTPSPPHEYVFADNPNIAFVVMFRARFSAAFPGKLPHYGPQDIEDGLVAQPPSERVERLLCALISLVLNRQKDVEKGHYSRALEEAIQKHSSQWPKSWNGQNPLPGSKTFNDMTPEERLDLLRALSLWALNASEAIQAILKDSYKQQRQEDDLNQPLSVQPWGRDGEKRHYYLIEGQDDTHFRLCREGNRQLKSVPWMSMAASIPELRVIAEKMSNDPTQAARRLGERIFGGLPRFEAGEEKRKRRDYRQQRKAQFTRPEPGFSLYEGRTRGKRMRYTFSDDEDDDESSARRSTRNSGTLTPAEGPVITASGRVSRYGRQSNGTSGLASSSVNGDEPVRASRSGRAGRSRYQNGLDGTDEEDPDGWNSADNEEEDDEDDVNDLDAQIEEDEADVDTDMSSDPEIDDLDDVTPRSLIVSLKYGKQQTADDTQMEEDKPPKEDLVDPNFEPRPLAGSDVALKEEDRSVTYHDENPDGSLSSAMPPSSGPKMSILSGSDGLPAAASSAPNGASQDAASPSKTAVPSTSAADVAIASTNGHAETNHAGMLGHTNGTQAQPELIHTSQPNGIVDQPMLNGAHVG